MKHLVQSKLAILLAASAIAIAGATVSFAQDFELEELGRGSKPTKNQPAPSYILQDWMHTDVGEAWSQGYFGSGTRITVVDDFSSSSVYSGDLGTGSLQQTHGAWTSLESSLIAPEANITRHDFTNSKAISLDRRKFNVVNLSYGMMAADGYSSVGWGARESSIISAAENGRAVVVKAAGNDYGTAVGEANSSGVKDYLNVDLIGLDTSIFVGALNANGSIDAPSTMASYSNIAGDNLDVQSHFVVVGVEGRNTGLYGTSFAAPIVSGYSAILHSKFKKATPTAITNRILDTARTDTILNYTERVYGQGEASLARALAPNSIQ